MTEQTPLKLAARALAELDDVGANRHINASRAVLLAMREPSEGMIEAGGERCFAGSRHIAQVAARNVWKVMIDAALGGDQ